LAQNYPDYFKPYILYYWQKLDFSNYELVISSSHSFCSNWVNVKGKHLSYIHTPPRFLYDEFNEMAFLRKFPFKQLLSMYFDGLRKKDFLKLQKIDLLIANSKNVQKRIFKYYKRKSIVLYPPVETKAGMKKKGDYYLFFSRLVKQKGGELAVRAFNQNGKKLLIVGEGGQIKKLKKISKKNIRFFGFQPDQKMKGIFIKTKALIYCSIDEDFGIIPVEAMSYGVPVIAYQSGGVKETIIDKKTGIFLKKYNVNSLNRAIEKFELLKFNKNVCQKQAKKFEERKFQLGIRKYAQLLLK